MKYDNRLKSLQSKKERLEEIDKELNFNAMLSKYGPEGLYLIADKLKELADEDVSNAINQCNNNLI